MKLAYVVPRYGLEVHAGAEHGARMLAERMSAEPGWSVEALTTCATSAATWENDYPPGTVDLNGVQVHRFPTTGPRDRRFARLSDRVLPVPETASSCDQETWIDMQGPRSPGLLDAVGATDADVVVFYPYLYHPTVRGLPLVAGRSVMHPAAHDEPPIRLPLFRKVFAAATALVFQTYNERRLVERLFPVASTRQIVLGLGVEEHPGTPDAARAALGLDHQPYLLYVGRVDDGKGTTVLARYFAAYKARRPGPLRLVLAGSVVHRPPAHPDVVLAGPVDEATKWGALRGATAFVMPSPFEAFSIAMMEAWTAGLPVLVNGACRPTREHCERSGGGLWFDGYASFEAAVDRLVADDHRARDQLAVAGACYVRRHFAWPVLIDRYRRFLEAVVSHR